MANIDRNISSRLVFAIALTAITLVAEIIGGIWSNSLALLSDAGHVFLDLFALALSLAAIKLAAQPPGEHHSYGLHRAEVLASLINGLTVFLMAIGILYEGSKRLIAPQEVQTTPMLVIAVLGLVANLLAANLLQGIPHHPMYIRFPFPTLLRHAAPLLWLTLGVAM